MQVRQTPTRTLMFSSAPKAERWITRAAPLADRGDAGRGRVLGGSRHHPRHPPSRSAEELGIRVGSQPTRYDLGSGRALPDRDRRPRSCRIVEVAHARSATASRVRLTARFLQSFPPSGDDGGNHACNAVDRPRGFNRHEWIRSLRPPRAGRRCPPRHRFSPRPEHFGTYFAKPCYGTVDLPAGKAPGDFPDFHFGDSPRLPLVFLYGDKADLQVSAERTPPSHLNADRQHIRCHKVDLCESLRPPKGVDRSRGLFACGPASKTALDARAGARIRAPPDRTAGHSAADFRRTGRMAARAASSTFEALCNRCWRHARGQRPTRARSPNTRCAPIRPGTFWRSCAPLFDHAVEEAGLTRRPRYRDEIKENRVRGRTPRSFTHE